MTLAAPPHGLPLAHGGCTCSCHRVPGITHFAPCCHPKLNMPTDPEWYRRKAELEGDSVISAGVPDKPVANMEEAFSREFDPAPEMFVCMDPTGCYHVSWTEQQHKEKMEQVGAEHEARYVTEARLSEAVEVLKLIASRPSMNALTDIENAARQFLDSQGGGNG